MGWDFNDLERILDLEIIRDGISNIWERFSIWVGFGMGFHGFGKHSRFGKGLGRDLKALEKILDLDSRFGKDLGWDFNDLERVLDFERIWNGISTNWKGFSIWRKIGTRFRGFEKDSRFGKNLGWDFKDLEKDSRFRKTPG